MSDRHLEYVELLLRETREELTKADNKVSVLLGTAGVAASILIGASAAGHRVPAHLSTWATPLWWLGVSAGLAGIVALASTLAPHIGHAEGKSAIRYFGHAAQFGSPAELLHALDTVNDPRLDRAVDQLWANSRLVVRKYRRVRFALMAFGVAAPLLIIAAGAG